MTIQSHLQLIGRAKWFIALVVIVGTLAGFAFVWTRPVTHMASMSFEIQFVNRPEAQDYRYGSYYELKASEMYVQHLMSLFHAPSSASDMLQRADVPVENASSGDVTKRFNVRQHSNQHFEVTFGDRDAAVTDRLATGVAGVVVENAATSGAMNNVEQFRIVPSEPFLYESRRDPRLGALIGLCGGILLSLVLVYLREYFRE